MLPLACQERRGPAWLQALSSQPRASPVSLRHWGCGAACRGSHADVAGSGCAAPSALRGGPLPWLGRETCSMGAWFLALNKRGELRGAVLTRVPHGTSASDRSGAPRAHKIDGCAARQGC